MKIRNTGYTNPLTGVTSSAPASSDEPIKPAQPAAPARAPVDEATILGIPPAELTPKVQAAIGQLMAEVQSLRDELTQAKKRVDYLEQLADQDTLTPVLNRRAFVRELTRIMSFAERYGASSSVLYFDVDDMKQINDSNGHAAGDAALAHVAQILTKQVRGSDIVGRLGGDEFGVILAQADGQEAKAKAVALAEAIQAEPVIWEGKPLTVKTSYGIHTFTPGEDVSDALHAADRAMYAQKRNNPPSDS